MHVKGKTSRQEYPGEIVQSCSHPSSSLKFPSSQISNSLMTTPSPQEVEQSEDVVSDPLKQYHPLTFPVQLALHFDVPSTSPSSQYSFLTLKPSPQISLQIEGRVAFPPVQL